METGSQLVWRPGLLVTRCGRESQCPAERVPRPPVEQLWRAGKRRWWPQEWGSICCSSVQSPTASHMQTFQIKWEVYFLKKSSLAFIIASICILHIYVYICIFIMWLYNMYNLVPWPGSGTRVCPFRVLKFFKEL